MSDDFSSGCGCGGALVALVALAGAAFLHYRPGLDPEAEAQAADVALDIWQARVESLEGRLETVEEQLEETEFQRDLLRMRVDDLEMRVED